MKKVIFSAIFFVNAVLSIAQSVTFNTNRYYYDNKPLLMSGNFGEWTNRQYVRFYNQSPYSITIVAHIHHHLTFIYFVDDDNKADHEININIPAGSSYTLNVIAKLSSGDPIVYNDKLGFDVRYQNNATAYFELDASAYFYDNSDNTSTSFTRPVGYNYISVNGLPARWSISDLPLTIYSNHTQYGFSSDYNDVLEKAVNMWNAAGKSVGLNVNFFEVINSSSNADIQMDWSGMYVPNGALGVAYPQRNIVGMLPLHRYDHLGAAGETLCQELCHLLGVEHSNVKYDIMNGTAHGHWHDLSQIQMTERDRQMLGWLYTRTNYYRFQKL